MCCTSTDIVAVVKKKDFKLDLMDLFSLRVTIHQSESPLP